MSDHKGFVLWFTGLSGAGKSTLARALENEFRKRKFKVEVLDGDEVRTNLSKGLGFSKEDRDTNIRRIGYVANLLGRNGVISITAAISPYRQIRDEVRAMCMGRFVEVFAKCTIEELTRRDVKGLYKKALAGEIKNFTGISDPYEEPENPEVTIDSGTQSIEESTQVILQFLESKGLIASAAATA
ncbi:MAG: adenylyl-sulfate kinase [Planctomycetota bacterium]|nr:MAG: adenylyl-sulfate kinase [Planctomycetota bacterium]